MDRKTKGYGLLIFDILAIISIIVILFNFHYLWISPVGFLMLILNMWWLETAESRIKPCPSTVSNTYRKTLLPNRFQRNGGRSQRLS